MVYTIINFCMSLFAMFMLEKMSRNLWSRKFKDDKESRETSQMDREVAAEWFDYMMIDKEFEFSNFMHNIPRETF